MRIAVVSTIAIATIAAFLLPKGLGYPIFVALKQPTPFKTEIYSAGGLAVGLALACDALLVAIRRALAPWTSRSGAVIVDTASLHTFVDAFRFIADNPGFLLREGLEQLELSGAALAIALLWRFRSVSCSAISIAGPASRSARRSSAVRSRASS